MIIRIKRDKLWEILIHGIKQRRKEGREKGKGREEEGRKEGRKRKEMAVVWAFFAERLWHSKSSQVYPV